MNFHSKTTINSLLKVLRSDVELSRGNTDVQKLVLKYGRQLFPVARPKGIRQRTRKQCFNNSFHIANDGRGFYVEGFAMKGGLRLHLAFHHAWSTRDGIHAFDTTLVDNSDCLYYGIVIPFELLYEHFRDGKTVLDYSTSYEEMETALQHALSSPPDYGTFEPVGE